MFNKVVGIVSPSSPANIWFAEKYSHAKSELQRCGFEIVESDMVLNSSFQGYRVGTARERAADFMKLFCREDVDIVMATIGGSNSASLLPYLDYEVIAASGKTFCGYSDATALHMALISKTNIPTIYGPAVVPSFGEYTGINEYTLSYFRKALSERSYQAVAPQTWSNHFLDAATNEWKQAREYKANDGWKILNSGAAEGQIIAANQNTLVSMLASEYVPNFCGKVLLLEEMDASYNILERNLNALKMAGVFDEISGLLFGKAENCKDFNSGLHIQDLLSEFIGGRNYPIVYNFDCCHTTPMLSIPQLSRVRLEASDGEVTFAVLENAVCEYLKKIK